jgi:hypothetical protein
MSTECSKDDSYKLLTASIEVLQSEAPLVMLLVDSSAVDHQRL